MEKRIKTLYIITICGIVALIAVQTIWLHRQWNISLREQESEAFTKMGKIMEAYRDIRTMSRSNRNSDTISWSNTNIDHKSKFSTNSQSAAITLTFYDYSIRKILGLDDSVKVTQEIKQMAHNKIQAGEIDTSECVIKKFEVDSTPLKTNVWTAADQVVLNHNKPFTLAGIDSLLHKHGLPAKATLVRTDTLLWEPTYTASGSILKPAITAVFPYGILEKKAVRFYYPIAATTVLKSMAAILAISAILSIMLIVCLVWQIRTVMHLVKLDAVRNNFIHTMIHELKRPVSTLKICISSLENPRLSSSDDYRKTIIKDCRDAINNLSTYFSRLRDITFNEAGQIPLNLIPCRLKPLIDKIISNIHIPSGKTVEINCNIHENAEIICDPLHLSQMAGNLVENAVKYSLESVTIDIEASVNGDVVSISVSDNGIGISETDCSKIFDKFYRSPQAMHSGMPGVGLGLAYVRLLAEAHGGTVKVDSREGKGSRFTIILPQS